jgi:hypothetical protein
VSGVQCVLGLCTPGSLKGEGRHTVRGLQVCYVLERCTPPSASFMRDMHTRHAIQTSTAEVEVEVDECLQGVASSAFDSGGSSGRFKTLTRICGRGISMFMEAVLMEVGFP